MISSYFAKMSNCVVQKRLWVRLQHSTVDFRQIEIVTIATVRKEETMMCVRKVFDESTFFPLLKIETFVLVRISKGSFIKEEKLNKKLLKIAYDVVWLTKFHLKSSSQN